MHVPGNPFRLDRPELSQTDRPEVARNIMGKVAGEAMEELMGVEEVRDESGMDSNEEPLPEMELTPEERERQERTERADRMIQQVRDAIAESEAFSKYEYAITAIPILARANVHIEDLIEAVKEAADHEQLLAVKAICYFQLVRLLAEMGRQEEAKALYEEACGYGGGHTMAHIDLVKTYASIGMLDKMDAYCTSKKMTALRYTVPLAAMEELLLTGQRTEAIDRCRALHASVSEPPYSQEQLSAYTALVKTMTVGGISARKWLNDVTGKIKAERDAQRLNISGDMLRHLCSAHIALGDIPVARRYIGFIDQKDGKSAEQREELVRALEKKGQHDEALQELRELIPLKTDRFFAPRLYAEMGELALADQSLEIAEASGDGSGRKQLLSTAHVTAKLTLATEWLSRFRQSE